mmetsp:Transcript_9953/g.16024  ORF Transcript_9953/g.16024 Transcript_9953/m.16024 type:complete len:241 (-) Transcript_9953:276-998(-)
MVWALLVWHCSRKACFVVELRRKGRLKPSTIPPLERPWLTSWIIWTTMMVATGLSLSGLPGTPVERSPYSTILVDHAAQLCDSSRRLMIQQMRVSMWQETFSSQLRPNSQRSLTQIYGLLQDASPSKSSEDRTLIGHLGARTRNASIVVHPWGDCLMPLGMQTISVPFSTEWDCRIRRLLPFLAPMFLVGAIQVEVATMGLGCGLRRRSPMSTSSVCTTPSGRSGSGMAPFNIKTLRMIS